jgi:VanZ family protein
MYTSALTRWIVFWWKTLLIVSLVTWLSLTPGDSVPNIHWFAHQDKLVHLLMYFALSYTLRWDWSRHPLTYLGLWAVVGAAGYGAAMEGLQYLTGYRSAEWLDLLANTTGALLGVLAFAHLHPRLGVPLLQVSLRILPVRWHKLWCGLWQL